MQSSREKNSQWVRRDRMRGSETMRRIDNLNLRRLIVLAKKINKQNQTYTVHILNKVYKNKSAMSNNCSSKKSRSSICEPLQRVWVSKIQMNRKRIRRRRERENTKRNDTKHYAEKSKKKQFANFFKSNIYM